MKSLTHLMICVLGSCFLVGCATTTPVDAKARALCIQTFGTDEHLRILYLPVTHSEGLATLLGSNSRELQISSAMRSAKAKRVDLVVWTEDYAQSVSVSAIERAPRYIRKDERLDLLNFLFVGDATSTNRLRPVIESTGAKFYFHQR